MLAIAFLLAACTTPAADPPAPATSTAAAITPAPDTAAAPDTAVGRSTVGTAAGTAAGAVVRTTAVGSGIGSSVTALAALANLPVKGRAPKTGYRRAQFGQTWTDDVTVDGGHNGCDTRNDVLRRDLINRTTKPGSQGCTVATGTLHDPYTGKTIDFVRGEKTSPLVQIDHIVALSNAWQTGAQALTAAARQNLAEDPLELLAVDGPTNESKGDGDAATWLSPVKSFRCRYVARQIAVKSKYSLWVTPAERDAMARVLGSCPGQALPNDASTAVPAIASN